MCQAREIVTDDQGRASGVRYLDADGGEHELRARVVVVACSAVESARLLLLSQAGRFPHGLANSSGLVGKNLVLSTFAGGESWLDPRGADPTLARALDSQHPFLQRTTQSWYWDERAGLLHPKVGSIVFLWHHPNPIHTAVSLAQASRYSAFGARLKDRIRDAYHQRRKVELECFVEFLPNPATHVTLDPKAVDRFGQAAARITIEPHASARPNALHLVNKGIEVLEATGASGSRGVLIGTTTRILQGGTCRFGHDPDQAVLDPDCQAFDVPNLFVTDGSFMPSGGSVPFTLTIMANAARVAWRIVDKARRGELA
jgi:choline dehydrogenase-like flavoprotein